ncbi:Melanopsin-A [Trichoplax sp. H2]|nr:Melanopsin-A [Trichoplax sp. H2]|eukprot:RDD35802.1 Melanopsin-A [Trichoplax sp. H2]
MLQRVYGNLPLYPGNTFQCRLAIGLPLYFGIVNIYSIGFLSVIRYIIITKPNKAHYVSSKKSIIAIYLLNWFIPLSFSLPQTIGFWARFPYYSGTGTCGPAIKLALGPSYITFFIYFYCFGLSIPFQAITFSYWHIYKEFSRNRQRIRNINVVTNEESKLESMISTNYTVNTKKSFLKSQPQSSINKGMEKKLAKTLLLIIFIEILSFIPMSIINLIESVSLRTSLVYQNYGLLVLLLTFLSGITNPFIFIFRSHNLRRSLKEKFICLNV